jgi:serine/threonine-protein kinase
MTPERWRQITEVFHAALAKDTAARGALLDDACAGDAALRAEVNALLSAHEGAGGFGERPLAATATGVGATELLEVTASEEVLRSGETLAHYTVTDRLGAGGMGVVYRATDTRLERDVALKVLPAAELTNPVARERLLREARTASRLNHPHVCTVHEVGEAGSRAYIAMEFVDGPTLSALVRDGGLPLEQALRYAGQIADALAHAHERGVIHRDLKCANVVITAEGRAKVLDFGLAKRLPDAAREGTESDTSITKPGTVAGTLAYMAPEQLRGQPADRRSDVWSFGVTLYEMLARARPFGGTTTFDLTAAILQAPPAPLPATVPPALRAVVARCLAKDPADRYASGGELRAALASMERGETVGGGRRPGRWLVPVMGLAALSAAALALNVGGVRSALSRAAPGPRIRSLAVLPLQNLSGDPQQEYVADGLTEALITDLARIGSLKVIARSSVMRYKGTKVPLADIARELGVDALLDGSALRSGSRIRVSAQLVDPRTSQALWAESYERDLTDVLRLQAEVAQAVAQRVGARLTSEEGSRLAAARPVDPEAYEAYLKGRFYNQKLSREDLDTALRYFEQALQKDPKYAPGYAGIASVWGARQQFGWASPQEAGPRRAEAVQRAMALDSELPEVRVQLARMKMFSLRDLAGAEADFRRAIELNPNYSDARVFYARLLNYLRRTAEAMPQIERAVELDPNSAYVHAMYAVDLCHARRYDQAIAEARLAQTMDPALPLGALRIGYVAKGMLKDALEVQITEAERRKDSELAQVLKRDHDSGRYRDAERSAAELLVARVTKGTPVAANEIAILYDAAGLPEKVLEWLEKAVDQRDPNVLGLDLLTSLSRLPGGDNDPRLRAVRRRIGLPS